MRFSKLRLQYALEFYLKKKNPLAPRESYEFITYVNKRENIGDLFLAVFESTLFYYFNLNANYGTVTNFCLKIFILCFSLDTF